MTETTNRLSFLPHFFLGLGLALQGPDHAASLEPGEFREMVDAVRNVERALGDGLKCPSPSERPNLAVARKSIVAATGIGRGKAFSEENLTVKRPGTGISPMFWDQMLSRTANRDYEPDDLIEW